MMKRGLKKSKVEKGYRGKSPNHGARIVVCASIIIVFCVPVKLFIVGEPVDSRKSTWRSLLKVGRFCCGLMRWNPLRRWLTVMLQKASMQGQIEAEDIAGKAAAL